jgi:dTDP-glucose 4,6-dehydratase
MITGGAGFIGSALVRELLANSSSHVLNVDALTYAGNLASVAAVLPHDRYTFAQTDITDREAMGRLFDSFRPDTVFHLAAESHVDRSIDGPGAFVRTNIVGTFTLIESARAFCAKLPVAERQAFRFVHVSTDEVLAHSAQTACFRKHRLTIRARPMQPAKRLPTIWLARGSTRSTCRS